MSQHVVDAGVVVTGAGHGIGKALATRLAAEGARVVVNDLDAEAAWAVAGQIGGYAAPGDAASEDGVAALVAAARDRLGEIDIWFANAGIDRGHHLDAPEADWATAHEVNVMAHVRAARLLVPSWVDRGSGRFVVTASAAGLLTMLGSPTYSVTKHAPGQGCPRGRGRRWPEKCRLLTEELGFDAAVDHRSPDFRPALEAATADGIDVYFENVGGPVTDAVVRRLNRLARIPVCGLVADYNATETPEGPDRLPGFMRRVLTLSLTVRGFIQDEFVPTHHDDWPQRGQAAGAGLTGAQDAPCWA